MTIITAGQSGTFDNLQAAIDAAVDGDTIMLAAGTYDGDVSIVDKQLTIVGAQAGVTGAEHTGDESIIHGRITVSGDDNVTFDGLKIVADEDTHTSGPSNPALKFSGDGDFVVKNTVFDAEFNGGANGVDARAISLDTTVGGNVTIENNLFTGEASNNYSGAAWGRGVWSDGSESHLTISGNTFDGVRSGLNLDGYDDATHEISGNVFAQAGSGISVGSPTGTAFTGIHDNDFQNVEGLNFQNVTTEVDIDLTGSHSSTGQPIIVYGGSAGDHITGSAGVDAIFGNGGADIIVGGGGNDAIDGGAGVDTVNYTGAVAPITWNGRDHAFSVATATEGTDTLTNVEVAHFDGHDVWLVSNSAELANALANAAEGSTIKLADGTYTGNVVIDTDGLTIESANGDASKVILKGDFKTVNHIGDDTTVGDYVKTHAYTGGQPGVSVAADGVTISNLTIREYNTAIDLQSNDGLTLNGLVLDENIMGVYKLTAGAEVTDFTMNGGTISHGYIGIYSTSNFDGAHMTGSFDGIVVDGTTFEHMTQKGMYFEQLSDAELTNLIMNDVGQYGGGSAFGAAGANGAGIDINLKYGSFSDITISDFTFIDVGTSNGLGNPPNANGSAISIKARDDGSDYGRSPAHVDDVTIENGSIDGTSTGIRFGEPGKTTAGATNVTVSHVDIGNAIVGSYDNQTTTIRNIVLSDGNDTVTTNPAATGGFAFTGGKGDDAITGSNLTDHAVYAGTIATHDISVDAATNVWTVSAGTEGTDQLKDVEVVDNGSGSHILLVGAGGFDSLQAAIDAAVDGDTIMLAAGTYDGDVSIVDKQLTIVGAQAGVTGAEHTGDESIIHGRITVSGDDNVTFDGLKIVADEDTHTSGPSNPALKFSGDGDFVVKNTVFDAEFNGGANGVDARAISLDTTVGGNVTIENNLFTGEASNNYSGAAWGRGVWSDGSESHLTISGNTFDGVRSGLNLDGYDDATHEISGNVFAQAGSGISVGSPTGTAFTGIHDNDFQNVEGLNFQNVTTEVDIDLTGSHSSTGQPIIVYGGSAGDHITGSAGVDFIFGNGGADVIAGAGGADAIDGGAGIDIATYAAGSTIAMDENGHWTVTTNGVTDVLSNVEKVTIGDKTYVLVDKESDGGFHSVQDAVDAAADGDTIVLAAGTYDGDVSITDKQLTIVGAQEGIAATDHSDDESVIHGRITVSGDDDVTIDGLKIVADGDTNTSGPSNPALKFSGDGDFVVRNTVFDSEFNGGANGVNARAISLDTTVGGNVTIENNLFTGTSDNNYSGAAWGRGVWSDGSESQLTISGNTFDGVRSGINLDGYDDATHEISGNVFAEAGTGISVGIPKTETFTGIHDNDFQHVEGLNFQNVTTSINIDLSATGNDSSTDQLFVVYGGTAGDHITGTSGDNYLVGGGGDDVIAGGGGNDVLTGDGGTDTVVFDGAWSDYTITRDNQTYTISDGTHTTTASGFENFKFDGVTVNVSAAGHADDIVTAAAPTITMVVALGADQDGNAQTVDVNENSAVGTQVAVVVASDANLTAGDHLTYSLVTNMSGNTPVSAGAPFSIDANGIIKVAGTLDHETTPSQDVFVKVTDASGHSVVRLVTVAIADVNEAPTSAVLDNASVSEASNGAVVGILSASDPENDTLSYTVGDDRFEVVTQSGQQVLKLKAGVALDHEATPSVSVTVTVDDGHGHQVDKAFDIAVNDVNEAPTSAVLDNASVSEASNGAIVGILSASDPENDGLTYTVNDSRFEIITQAGQQVLKLKAGVSLDREATPSVNVTVTVDDGHGHQVGKAFDIAVTDVNEAPTAPALDNASVSEASNGAVVGILSASDPENNDLTYTVGDSRFEIVRQSGQQVLKLKDGVSLDHEATPSVSVTVTVDDGHGHQVNKAFDIAVTDVNEASTAPALDNATVSEGSNGAVVGILSASDPENDGLTYTVGDNRFEIVTQSGHQVLKLKDGISLDHETTPSVSVTVTVDDGHGHQVGKAFDIAVTDVNEAPSAPALDNTSVFEASDGEIVGVLSASDPENDGLTYTVNDDRFEVVTLSGQQLLKLKDGVSLDHETTPSVNVTVTADDGHGHTVNKAFDISVTDVNEAPFGLQLDGGQTGSVDEDEDGAVVGVLTAQDPDGDAVSFSVVGEAAARFEAVNQGTAEAPQWVLKLRDDVSIDFEAEPTATIEVGITGSDGQLSSAVETFTINVINHNDTPAGETLQSTASIEQGSTRAALNIAPLAAANGDTLTYTVNTRPSAGTIFLNGVAIGAHQVLTQTELQQLTYSAPDDGVGTTLELTVNGANTVETALTINIDVSAAVDGTYNGTNGADRLDGAAGDDTVLGGAGRDNLLGGSGRDSLEGGAGADQLQGGAGLDTASYASANKGVTVSLAKPSLNTGDAKGDTFASIENLTGSQHQDVLAGDRGDNVIRGGAGADRLTGGHGADALYGGTGADVFVFNALSDSTVKADGRDTIFNFGANDRFDLSAIDANSDVKGNQTFTFIGTDDFDGKAGELRFEKKGGDTYVYADTDGDKHADFAFHLDDGVKLVKHDFLL